MGTVPTQTRFLGQETSPAVRWGNYPMGAGSLISAHPLCYNECQCVYALQFCLSGDSEQSP